MIVIGFMHYRKKPTNRAYAFAAVAKAEGAELLYFSPGAVDFENKKINGYIYQNGEWVNVISNFPDIICNVAGFSKDKQNAIVERLHEEIPFTSYSIGSKETVYRNIMKYKEFSHYLVPSEKVLSANHFFNLLDKHGEIVFKPSMGSQGKDVYYVSKEINTEINAENSFYKILNGIQKTIYDHSEISDFISNKIREEEYLIQPYINCRTKSGDSYDLRLHVQKNIKGDWVITKIYPRIAISGSILCNLSRGGYTIELTSFLKREFEDDFYNMQKYIEAFSLQLAAHMDKIQKDIYKEDLDELGIDIGIDKNQKICIYEVNWRPGAPPSLNIELNVVKNAVNYAMFLAGKSIADKLKLSGSNSNGSGRSSGRSSRDGSSSSKGVV